MAVGPGRRLAGWLLVAGWVLSVASPPLHAAAGDALLFTAPAGGARKGGSLTSCDDERCLLDGAAVPLVELAWIGLGVGGEPPPAGVTARGVVLADGTVRPGRFLGLSLGSVLLDEDGLDRALVRWIRVAEVPPPVDVLVRRDGALRTGALQGCAAERCTMGGESSTRAELAWIGLAIGPESIDIPAAPDDPARDLVQLVDGSTRTTRLVGLGTSEVVLSLGTLQRTEIAWIYLAPPAAEPGPPPIHRPSPPSRPQPSQPPRPPPPGPPLAGPPQSPPPAQPPGPGPTGGQVCDPREGMAPGSGAVWTGTARMYMSLGGPGFLHEDRSEFEVELREVCETPVLDLSVTPHRRIGTITWLDSGGTVQHDWRREVDAGPCHCEGSKTITEPPWIGGSIYRRTAAGDATAALSFDLPAQPFYWLVLSSTGATLEVPCRGETCGGIGGRTLMQLNAGRFPNADPALSWDRELRAPEGGILRGAYTRALGPATLDVAWSICRAGVQCPPLPEPPGGTPPEAPPPPETDPCGDLAQSRALVDVLWDRRQFHAAELKPLWERLERVHAAMLDDAEAYFTAIDICAVWDIVSEALEAWTMKLDGEAEALPNWGAEFVEFGVKLLNGDISASMGAEPWKSLSERATDAFPDEPDWAGNMRARVTGCGAVWQDLRSAALRFIDNWELQRALMPRVQEQINRIRDLDQRYWDEWHSYYRRCRQWATCKGLPLESCPAPPEQPGGPMPPAPSAPAAAPR